MAVRKINESTLTAIGNAIRSKTGGSALINPEDMADEIDSISGVDTSGLSYSSSIIVPTNEIGRLANGGYPTAMNYFKSLLPSNFVFARLKLDESAIQNVPNYFLYELTFAVLIRDIDNDVTPVFLKRIVNGEITNLSITSEPSGWSVIISPDYSYKLEIWSSV